MSFVLAIGARAADVRQWEVYEISFTAGRAAPNPYLEQDPPPLRVVFRNAATGTRLMLDAFWDGGRDWKVRFAPPEPGVWQWTSESADAAINARRGEVNAVRPSESDIARNPNFRGHIRVGPTRRYFVYADGTPFFWLGDTLWAMGSLRCGLGTKRDGPFFQWLADRKAKGFTVAFGEYVELTESNEGGLPFPGSVKPVPALEDLNPEYFRALDARVQAVHDAGMVLAAHPMWVGKHHGPSPAAVRRLSRYLLARYGAYNIVWSLSGEYQYSYAQAGTPWTRADWQSLGEAVASFNPYRHPVSVHPSGQQWSARAKWPRESYSQSSAGEFHSDAWLDHNWTQTGHAVERLWLVVSRTQENYARTPVKPVIHSEGFYENHWESGATPAHARWQAWAAMLNGAAGHGYGAHPLWGFYDPPSIPAGTKDHLKKAPWDSSTWREALRYAGGAQLRHFADYFRSIAWWTLEPRRDGIQTEGRAPDVKSLTDPHLAASVAGLHVAYIPEGNRGRRVQIDVRASGACSVRRLNPRDGSAVRLARRIEPGAWDWTVPDDQDWVIEIAPIDSAPPSAI